MKYFDSTSMLFFLPKLIFMDKMRVLFWLRSKLNAFLGTWSCQPSPDHDLALWLGDRLLWGESAGWRFGTCPGCHTLPE